MLNLFVPVIDIKNIPSDARICNEYSEIVSLSIMPFVTNLPFDGSIEKTLPMFPNAIEYVIFPFVPASMSAALSYNQNGIYCYQTAKRLRGGEWEESSLHIR